MQLRQRIRVVFGMLGGVATIPTMRGPWYEASERDVRGPRNCIIQARVMPWESFRRR